MANFTYGSGSFRSTTFTSPLVGTSDVITANNSADFTINGNGGNDTVTSGSGNDTITTGSGNDVIRAGDGNNTVSTGDGGTDSVTTGSGNDTITTAGGGNDTVNAGSGNNTVTTGSGADVVNSGGGNDTITTGAGADIVNSGGGDDTVHAGTGNDRITAGAGNNVLWGDGGHDTFVYRSLAEAGQVGVDVIHDFSISNPNQNGEGDVLDLRGLVDDFSGQGGSLSQLVSGGYLDFSGDSTNTVISFDSNGSAAGGVTGVLVTLVGVGFSGESNAVSSFADNIMV